MNSELLETVKQAGADAWEIHENKEAGWEFYFIRHNLDQNRAVNVTHTFLKLYKRSEDGKRIGSAQAELAPTSSKEVWAAELQKLLKAASLGTAENYELVSGDENAPASADFVREPIEGMASDFITMMKEIPQTATEDINSYEIFTKVSEVSYWNSNGVSLTQKVPSSFLEVIVDARNESHEIELYRSYQGGGCDRAMVGDDLRRAMVMGRDRLHTEPTPKLGTYPVVFTTGDAVSFYNFFLQQLSADAVYGKMSQFTIGKNICADDAAGGDRLTIRAVKELANSSANALFDADGALIRDETLLEDNIPVHFWGSRQFAQYLGLQDTFRVGNFAAAGGTHEDADLAKEDYLEPVEFSDFQVEGNGDFFGEIRLAYWHHGSEVTPVSGGSVSGNVLKLLGTLTMSKHQKQYDHALIPAWTRLDGVTVSGVEDR